MIDFINVTKQYSNGVKALGDINIHIEKGEFVFLVGTSGAGKSTFIKLLLKEEEPTKGKIFFNDNDITKVRNRHVPIIRRGMGVVFQDFRLLNNKTVFENVAFAMEIIGGTSKEIRRRVPSILSMVSLSKKADCYPKELSGGEQQRTAIARAIVNNPRLLIADEPTGNLDPDTAWDIMKLLKMINRRGTTILMATHAKEIVDVMKRRVIELDTGIVARDDAKGVYDHGI
ncbi:cell division ATP-binding protein FtsE [Abyssisolibacter fermentans]|uniref:cell division ATP-binding protein FtsE n=1 Tax=Abyssisolibacter fermentans TaxID=1766203 RepID=UPI000829E295|nr:cell division ATP-binding protein FtsE [Abyssisolibacter fermentans]